MAALYKICKVDKNRSDLCRSVLTGLPDWFGIPEATANYVASVEELPMLAAYDQDGTAVAFISLKLQTSVAVEAYVLGVVRAWHRQGVGRALFAAAEKLAESWGARYLTVKTLAASHPDPHYKDTRLFYEAIGFEPLEVFPTLWGDQNPCLLLIKPVRNNPQ